LSRSGWSCPSDSCPSSRVVGFRCPCQLVDRVQLLAGVELGEFGRADDVAAFAVAILTRALWIARSTMRCGFCRTVGDGFQPVFVVAEAAQSVDQLFARVVGPLRVAVQDVVGSAVEQGVGVLTDGPATSTPVPSLWPPSVRRLNDQARPSWRRVSVAPGVSWSASNSATAASC
jgi:hypothetical protein